MKKIALLLILAAVAFCFTGCVSVETVGANKLNGQALAPSGNTVFHVNIQNSGLYLFNIPLITGSTENVGYPAVFSDTVNVGQLTPVLAKEAKKQGGTKVLDVASQYNEFGFIIFNRTLNMSGNVIR